MFGQSCDTRTSLGNYLLCLKGALDANYGEYEQELRAHSRWVAWTYRLVPKRLRFRRAAESCFSQTIADANSKGRCVLALTDLESKAWDRNGPLRDCSICRTVPSIVCAPQAHSLFSLRPVRLRLFCRLHRRTRSAFADRSPRLLPKRQTFVCDAKSPTSLESRTFPILRRDRSLFAMTCKCCTDITGSLSAFARNLQSIV